MLRVAAGGSAEALAGRLAGVLAEPLADPMAPEWIVVASAGTQRWLRLELSRHLGTSGDGRVDGVAANLDLIFPGRLTRRVLSPGPDAVADPWNLERVAWVVLAVLDSTADDRLGPLNRRAPGATNWGRARRLADLFDRYLLHRPGMIRRWASGHDVDGLDRPISARAAWQPYLWRLVRDRIGEPSPAEIRPERLAALRGGECPDEIPERISLFGLTTIPGGAPFLDLLDALGTQRDVHLLLHQPSPAMTRSIGATVDPAGHGSVSRSDDVTPDVVRHPLLRSWARPAREGLVLIGNRLDQGDSNDGADAPSPTSLLTKVQADLRADSPPAGDFRPAADDRSIRFHSCHGATRQVEVLRDQILHLLADDPTLTEDDVVVFCPALDDFAQVIESVLGPPAGSGRPHQADGSEAPGPPTLSYRVTDRSLRAGYPLLGALAALVELLDSRFSDAAVLDFANLGPVRERFALEDTDLTTLADWVETANIRWGLDGVHRRRWGIPSSYEAGSWRTALDRLLIGIAVTDDPAALAAGEIHPIGVEGTNVAVAGRLADLLGRLSRLADDADHDRPVREWMDLLTGAAASLLAVDPENQWQASRLAHVLEEIADHATIADTSCPVDLALADIRHLLGRRLQGTAGRADFFRGGITISSFTPLRGLPYRVVCLLGMDESAFAARSPDGDDLTIANPHVGDRDGRADTRQALLETVLATQEHLVVVRSGHSVVTNQPVPAAVVVSELEDVIASTLDDSVRSIELGRLSIVHPRQSFDERNFRGREAGSVETDRTGPWSFDSLARAGAAARGSVAEPESFLAEPLTARTERVIDLARLHEFLVHPPRFFLRTVLDVNLADNPQRSSGQLVAPTTGASGIPRAAEGRDLQLTLDALETWGVRDRFLSHRRAGGDTESFLPRERAGDRLPPGLMAEATLDEAEDLIDKLIAALDDLGTRDGSTEQHRIDVRLADGTRIVGTVSASDRDHPGPVIATVSRAADKQRLGPWLDLLVLTAQDPTTVWSSVLLNRPGNKNSRKGFSEQVLKIPLPDPQDRLDRAMTALELVVDLYRRGCREPLPLFTKLSPALHRDNSPSYAWNSSRYSIGDDADKWIQVAFENAGVEQITSLPVRADDPPGPADDRAQRYADHLWGAIVASMQGPENGAAS